MLRPALRLLFILAALIATPFIVAWAIANANAKGERK